MNRSTKTKIVGVESRSPLRLRVVYYNGRNYFMDTRLKEFRAVYCPYDNIPFNSTYGQAIISNIIIED